jgi:hypothetical protein
VAKILCQVYWNVRLLRTRCYFLVAGNNTSSPVVRCRDFL